MYSLYISCIQRTFANYEHESFSDIADKTKAMEAALGMGKKSETEMERLIRLGEMTPFGTSMSKINNENPSQSNAKSKQPISEFEKYLQDQASKSASKQGYTKKKSSNERKRDSKLVRHEIDEPLVKKTKMLKSKSAPDLMSTSPSTKKKSHKNGNRFDAKDKRRYQPYEKDFSSYKQRNRRYRLDHQWSGDPELSDFSDNNPDEFHPNDDEWKPGGDDWIDEEEDGPYGTGL